MFTGLVADLGSVFAFEQDDDGATLGTSGLIMRRVDATIDGMTLIESGAIVDYIIHRHAQGIDQGHLSHGAVPASSSTGAYTSPSASSAAGSAAASATACA